MRIDVHAHYYAASYIAVMEAAGRTDVRRAAQPDDLDERLAVMDAAGVDVTVFSAIGMDTGIADPAGSRAAARHINDLYADLRIRYDGRFTGFASVGLEHPDLAVEEATRALDDLRLPGIALPCVAAGKPIDDAGYERFWRHLGERGTRTVVYVHPVGTDSSCHPGLADWGLNMLLGSPLQIAMAPLRLALSGITTRYPDLQFVFGLCGGVLPYLWQRYERNLRKGLAMNSARPGPGMFSWMRELPFDENDPMALFRRNLWFDSSVQDIPAALRLSRETYGIDRVLLGSDETHASLADAVAMIEGSPDLTAEEKHHLLDVAAQELLRLPNG